MYFYNVFSLTHIFTTLNNVTALLQLAWNHMRP